MGKTIAKHAFKPGLPVELEIVSISNLFQQNRTILTAPHRTSFYHIIWFETGTPTHLVDFKPIQLQPNTLLFVRQDAVHFFDPVADFEANAILFTDQFFSRSPEDRQFLRTTILFNDLLEVASLRLGADTSLFAPLFQLMNEESAHREEKHHADVLRNLLHSFLLLADRERRKQNFVELKKGIDLNYTLLFRELIEGKYKELKRVGEYAAQLNVTEKRLNRATSKVLGQSPKQIIDERVMLEARRLLAHTTDSVKEIGYFLGFQEPTNFVKYFHKHGGDTPAAFRGRFSV